MSRSSRRAFLGLALTGAGTLLLAACGQPAQPTNTPPAKPAEAPKPVAPTEAPKAAAAAPAAAAPKPGGAGATITYWNDYGGANGKVMDQLLDQFQKESGVKVEQQRMGNQDVNAKLRLTNQS